MIFEQHYLECLSQASYFIGDETTGRAVVVDPRRDVAPYLETASEHGMRIDVTLVDTVPLGVDTPADLERACEMLKPGR